MAAENVMVNSLEELEEEEKKALAENKNFYEGQIGAIENKYDEMIAATEAAGEEAKKQQQEQSDFAIAQIEQQKEQAQKDYEKEQSAAYVDYTKQTQKHGVAEEQMAAMGMNGSGYSESSRVAMYTEYQNRVATARASIEKAKVAYDNAITQARLANDADIAEIALQTLQNTMKYEMESLMQTQALQEAARAKQLSIQSTYNTQRNTLKEQNKSMLTELIKTGYTPSAEELTAAGMTQAEVDAMAGYIIGDGDGVLTEEELLNDPTRYNMDGLGAFGKGLTEEDLEELVKAGIVKVTADTKQGVVRFEVADKKAARNYLEVIKPQMEKMKQSEAPTSGSDRSSGNTDSEPAFLSEQKEAARKAREEASEAREDLIKKQRAAKTNAEYRALVAEEQRVADLEKKAAELEDLYNYYAGNYKKAKEGYEKALADAKGAWAEYERLARSGDTAQAQKALANARKLQAQADEYLKLIQSY